MNIGDWAMREKFGVGHLVESLVAGDVITRCGRRLTDTPTSGGALLDAPFGTRKCRTCTATRELEDT